MGNTQKPRDRQGIAAFAWKRVPPHIGTPMCGTSDAEQVKANKR